MISNNYRNYESCNLDEWIKIHSSENDMKELFLNMDKALKYIHEHDYCINDFSPTQIDVLENRPDYVQFVSLIQLSPDPIRKKKRYAQMPASLDTPFMPNHTVSV